MKRENWKYTEISPLDPGLPDDAEWNESIQSGILFSPDTFTDLNDGQYMTYQQILGNWSLAFHYLHKIGWDPGYKIPLPRTKSVLQKAQPVKAFAEVLLAFKVLCEKLHTGFGLQFGYTSAGHWFTEICWELQTAMVLERLHDIPCFMGHRGHGKLEELAAQAIEQPRSPIRGHRGHGKLEDLAAMIHHAKSNPFDSAIFKHQSRLAEAVLSQPKTCLVVTAHWKGKRSQKEGERGLATAITRWASTLKDVGGGCIFEGRYIQTAKSIRRVEIVRKIDG